ncbi:PQQ-binding-like beta-propeller repeat protein [Halorubrum sp. DTA98]|uniref:beta-alanine-activating enzyme beta-propeller domain-containing protein n=1 Tax=Halorubrum sp. DTA98 TaxID=3402163 RepID=UPI003AAD86A9
MKWTRRSVLQSLAVTAGLTVAAPATSQTRANDEWPSYQFDEGSTGFVPDREVPNDPTEAWLRSIGGIASTASPVVDADNIYIGTLDGALYAVERTSGRSVWQFEADERIRSAPAVDDTHVYIGSEDQTLYALDRETGDRSWSVNAGSHVIGAPTVANDRVFVGTGSGDVLAIDSDTGDLQWASSAGSEVASAVSVYDQRVYVGSSSGAVHALDLATGGIHWTFATGAYVYASPAVDESGVYAIDVEGTLFALDHQGTQRWTHSFGDRVDCSPAVGSDRVYVSGVGSLWAFEATTGELIWRYDLDADVYWNSPLIAADSVLVGSGDVLHAIDAESGESRWTLDGGAATTPVLADERIYTTTENHLRVVADESAIQASTASNPPSARIVVRNDGSDVVLSAEESSTTTGTIAEYEWDLDGEGTFERSGSEIRLPRDRVEGTTIALRITTTDGTTDTAYTSVSQPSGRLSQWWQAGIAGGIASGSVGGYLYANETDDDLNGRVSKLSSINAQLLVLSLLCLGMGTVSSFSDLPLSEPISAGLSTAGITTAILVGLSGSALLGSRSGRWFTGGLTSLYGIIVASFAWIYYTGGIIRFVSLYNAAFWLTVGVLLMIFVTRSGPMKRLRNRMTNSDSSGSTDDVVQSESSPAELSEQAKSAKEAGDEAFGNGDLERSLTEYDQALDRYRTALERTSDESVATDTEAAIEDVREARTNVRDLQQKRSELIEQLEVAERAFRKAILAHVQRKQTLPRIRYQQAQEGYSSALDQIEAIDEDVFTVPLVVEVETNTTLPDRLETVNGMSDETIEQLADVGIETLDALRSADFTTIETRHAIDEETVTRLRALSWLSPSDSVEFGDRTAISDRRNRAKIGYDAVR